MCKPSRDVTENTILAASSCFCFYETSQKTPNTIRVNHKTCQAKTNRTQVVHNMAASISTKSEGMVHKIMVVYKG
ncbi:hypothetical protein YC2023_114337 [Brassica napus]